MTTDQQRRTTGGRTTIDGELRPRAPSADGANGAELRTREEPAGKVDVGKRIVAGVIDAVLALVLGFVPVIGGIAAAAYWLVRDGLELEFMHRRSLGKAVMKLEPVRLDGAPMDLATSARRNWMFALGGVVSLLLFIPLLGWLLAVPVGLAAFGLGLFELFRVVTDDRGRRWGDRLAGTRVREAEAR